MEKLTLLVDGAKYDAACTSSGSSRAGGQGLGNAVAGGICHSFAADGRCISLLKVLLTNHCVYDCKYCVNRRSNDIPRTAFTPEELADITIQFYRRNYIEGLFLSSGVYKSPDYTTELMIRALELLRYKHGFWGYIHAKAIPGASQALLTRLGYLADRLSVNIEMPSEQSLRLLAPSKTKQGILAPMRQIAAGLNENRQELMLYQSAPRFAPAGQATQMIIGATPDTDYQIMRLSSGLYKQYGLRRVFYSAYVPAVEDSLLPAVTTRPPLLREHRLYQADFLLRQYNFSVEELLDDEAPNFNPYLDPKCSWALMHPGCFPVDVNRAPLNELLRVPGIGPKSAQRIVAARRHSKLTIPGLKKLGVVLKRAQYFILTQDLPRGQQMPRQYVVRALIDPTVRTFGLEQTSLFQAAGLGLPGAGEVPTLHDAIEEAILCLSAAP